MADKIYWAKNEARKLFEEALKLEAEGKTREAAAAYQMSVNHWPHDSQVQYNLGVALATLGELEQAIRAWKRAVWLEPSLKQELEKAFSFDADLVEDTAPMLPYNTVAKAA